MPESNVYSTTGSRKTSMGLDENVAGALCYILGFISGIIFLLMEKDSRFVKFHAVQSIGISLALVIFNIIISSLYGIFSWSMFWLVATLSSLISLVALILWIFLIMKAFQGEIFKLPIIGDIAEKQAGI
jgi:uncharacterized membrane protein